MVIYEWDETKNQTNIRKHGVAFEEAQTVFEDPGLFISEDDGPWGEERSRVIGWSAKGRQLFVVCCQREETNEGEVIRIISARKLTARERRRLGIV